MMKVHLHSNVMEQLLKIAMMQSNERYKRANIEVKGTEAKRTQTNAPLEASRVEGEVQVCSIDSRQETSNSLKTGAWTT